MNSRKDWFEFKIDKYLGSMGFRSGRLIISWMRWKPRVMWYFKMRSCYDLKLGPLEIVWVRRW